MPGVSEEQPQSPTLDHLRVLHVPLRGKLKLLQAQVQIQPKLQAPGPSKWLQQHSDVQEKPRRMFSGAFQKRRDFGLHPQESGRAAGPRFQTGKRGYVP